MKTKSFTVNKGVDADMEFQGFSAQYIVIAALGLLASLLLFTCCYALSVPLLLSIPLCGGTYVGWYVYVHRLNKTHGRFGLMKKETFHKIPTVIKVRDRGYIRNLTTSKISLP